MKHDQQPTCLQFSPYHAEIKMRYLTLAVYLQALILAVILLNQITWIYNDKDDLVVEVPEGSKKNNPAPSRMLHSSLWSLSFPPSLLSSSSYDLDSPHQHPLKQNRPEHHYAKNSSTTSTTSSFLTSRPSTKSQESSKSSTICCYESPGNITNLFTKEYFSKKAYKVKWTQNSYTEWTTVLRQVNAYSDLNIMDCESKWKQTVLKETGGGFYLNLYMKDLLAFGTSRSFRYVEDEPHLPRVLLLGDSISRGTWAQLQDLMLSLNTTTSANTPTKANIHGAPTNCGGFGNFKKSLKLWLGSCPWDLIQFNVGMHFNSKHGFAKYQLELAKVFGWLREHSPNAKIVFALTTPSPFDSNATFPDEKTCKNYHLFHKQGIIPKMNEAARKISARYNVTINDRYSAIHPMMEKYQLPCDIHFEEAGYELLARNDWEVIKQALHL
jgi:hypothetical protein